MHFYREVLRAKYPAPMLVLGVVETGPLAHALLGELATAAGSEPMTDVFAFCSGRELPLVLSALGVARVKPATGACRLMPPRGLSPSLRRAIVHCP